MRIWMARTMRKTTLVISALMICSTPAWADGDSHDGAAHAPAAWASMDSDSNGVLTRQEVATTPWADRFDQIDRNGDGQATKTEFADYMKDMQQSQSERDKAQPSE